mmetsp:Transcript_27990/g.65329  ORF Transcript_27990/g.65329 Transcript_27990/m.65329 type:complete len:192 (-) Transcript_27990:52-627(-)
MAAFTAALFCAVLGSAAARRFEGVLPASNVSGGLPTVFFAGKFCFDHARGLTGNDEDVPVAGTYELRIDGQVAQRGRLAMDGLSLMVFSDEESSWPHVREHWNELSCDEWRKHSRAVEFLSQDLSVPPHHYEKLVKLKQQLVPRFWYFVFVNCGGAEVLEPLKFEIHTRNVRRGDQAELGIDEISHFMVAV